MEENKYLFEMEEAKKADNEEAREARRKKRARSRALSWIFLLLFVLALGFAVFAIVSHFAGPFSGKDSTTSVSADPDSDGTSSVSGQDVGDTLIDLIGKEDDVVVEEPDPSELEPTEEEKFDEAVRNYVLNMSLEDRVAGVFVVSPEQLTGVDVATLAGNGTQTALNAYAVGGIIYSEQNIISSDQFKTMLSKTQSFARYPLFLALEEEPGNTVLQSKLGLDATMTASEIGASLDPQKAYSEMSVIGAYLREYGINLDLGVVADVATDAENASMDTRVYGADVNLVSSMILSTVTALTDNGVSAGLKFFPGEYDGSNDTSNALSISDKTKEELESNELKTFMSGVNGGADVIVVSHVEVPEIAGENIQSSLSKAIMTDLIRVEMGLDDTIIMTDAMNKAAISDYYEAGESAIQAIKAGADMILEPADFESAYSEVLEAVKSGVISENRINDSLVRIYKVKFKGKTSEEVEDLLQALIDESANDPGKAE